MVYENYQAKLKDSNDSVDGCCVPATLCKHPNDPLAAYDEEDDEDSPRAPKFSPPAYIQRYLAVGKVLVDPRYHGKIKKVVDFGCSEMGFVTHLKHTPGIEEILCVDVDRDTLECHKDKAIPLNADYLQNRSNPLTIHVLEGSVTHRDKRLANSDAVVAIELIEHLYPDTLMDFPYNVFGYIKPLVATITTPNADFNVLFPRMKSSELRHWDHKFEWTREQFEDWAKNIVLRYPEYDVSFQGICPGPPGTEEFGCCSQMAIFTRVRAPEIIAIYGIEGLLKTVTSQEYPYRIDNRSDEEKILDEASYQIRRFMQNNSECLEEYPLAMLLQNLEKFYISAETLREILSNGGWVIIDRDEGPAIQCPALSTFSDHDFEIENDDILDPNYDWPNFAPGPGEYGAGFGTWGDDNIETQYEERWDDNDDIPVTLVSPNNPEPINDVLEVEFPNTRNIGGGDNVETHYSERWDDDYEIPATFERLNAQEPIEGALEVELSLTRSIDTADFDSIVITNLSHVPSSSESIAPGRLSTFEEPFEISQQSSSLENSQIAQNQNLSLENEKDAVIDSKKSNIDVETINRSLSLIESPDFEETRRSSRLEEISYETPEELASLCSIYLESSGNEELEPCPEITNSSFDCTSLERSFENSTKCTNSPVAETPKTKENCLQKRLSLTNVFTREQEKKPKFSSSPKPTLEPWRDEAQKSSVGEDPYKRLKSSSQISLQSNGNLSTTTSGTSSSTSFRTVKKWYPPEVNSMYKNGEEAILKGGNESADVDDETLEIKEIDSALSVERNLSSPRLVLSELANCSKESKEDPQEEEVESRSNLASYVGSIVETVAGNLSVCRGKNSSSKIEKAGRSRIGENYEILEVKSASPETPPDSWSPEIMDSGYPNSSSIQDMTPENDLSSIAQDRISDSESPSIAEAPRLGFHEHAEVENGDLANNNRDGEGNNMIAAIVENELDENLQPLIDVLENDIENENDIYALENGFPMWLLRILERGNAAGRQAFRELREPDEAVIPVDVHAAGDAGMPDLDEGFDGTSSENDSDDDDDEDDENIEEISTASSEETNDWNISGDC